VKRLILAALLTLTVAACMDSGEGGPRGPEPARPTATSQPERAAYHARDLIVGFKRAGLPVGKVSCYDEKTDPNHLLGRPGGYTEKCDWSDKREQPTTEPTTGQGQSCSDPDIDPLDKELCEGAAAEDVDLIGGSIEVFDTPGLALQRATYLHGFEGPGPLNPGWTFIVPDNATHVLRIDSELTKAQAEAYRQAMRDQFP
jgi:hypothetical protein